MREFDVRRLRARAGTNALAMALIALACSNAREDPENERAAAGQAGKPTSADTGPSALPASGGINAGGTGGTGGTGGKGGKGGKGGALPTEESCLALDSEEVCLQAGCQPDVARFETRLSNSGGEGGAHADTCSVDEYPAFYQCRLFSGGGAANRTGCDPSCNTCISYVSVLPPGWGDCNPRWTCVDGVVVEQ